MAYSTDATEKKAMGRLSEGLTHDLSDDEVLELLRALENWRQMAVYFGAVLAANAVRQLDMKSTSKSERSRQAVIVLHAHSELKHQVSTYGHYISRETVVERLQGIISQARSRRRQVERAAEMKCYKPCPGYGPWNGLCPAGKHSLDFRGQPCDLCAKPLPFAPALKRECESCGHKYDVKATVDFCDGSGVYSSSKDWCPKCGGAAKER